MSFQYNIWFALYKHTVKIELMTVENKQTNMCYCSKLCIYDSNSASSIFKHCLAITVKCSIEMLRINYKQVISNSEYFLYVYVSAKCLMLYQIQYQVQK